MRFEVFAAFLIGVLLPVLETIRRGFGHWGVNFTTMFEDHVAGGVLILAGIVSIRGKSDAPLWLILAWSYVTGMMGGSFWDQLESTLRGIDLEPYNHCVLMFKFLLWGISLLSLILSFKKACVQRNL